MLTTVITSHLFGFADRRESSERNIFQHQKLKGNKD